MVNGDKNLNDKELKGKDILGENFKYGIASMKNNELKFLSNFFDLLIARNVSNMVFSVNKTSFIIDNRLGEWILTIAAKKFVPSARLLKYTLNKY